MIFTVAIIWKNITGTRLINHQPIELGLSVYLERHNTVA